MKKIRVNLGERSYTILIGKNILSSLGRFLKAFDFGKKVIVVSRKPITSHFYGTVRNSLARAGFGVSLYKVPYSDDRNKALPVLSELWGEMINRNLDRDGGIVALGGGTIGDLTGFAASTYKRGVPLVQVPTTLLAQVDSSIGGKTAINLPLAKNIVGTFYQPRMVVSDVETLATLSVKEFRHSFAEVIKYGVIKDPELFALLERKGAWFIKAKTFRKPQLSFLETIIWRSARIKADVVERDEYETKDERIILNYGHTFAHALEAASKFRIQHGEAVARGMILAGDLACRMGIFSEKDQQRQINLIHTISVPKKYRFTSEQLLPFMRRDKKVRNGKLRFVLPVKIGRVKVFDDVPEKLVKRVLEDNRG